MKYRIEFDASFTDEKDAVDFLNQIQGLKSKLFDGVGDEKIAIISKCRYHECYHDENPPKPCGNYTNFDLKNKVIVDVKTKEKI